MTAGLGRRPHGQTSAGSRGWPAAAPPTPRLRPQGGRKVPCISGCSSRCQGAWAGCWQGRWEAGQPHWPCLRCAGAPCPPAAPSAAPRSAAAPGGPAAGEGEAVQIPQFTIGGASSLCGLSHPGPTLQPYSHCPQPFPQARACGRRPQGCLTCSSNSCRSLVACLALSSLNCFSSSSLDSSCSLHRVTAPAEDSTQGQQPAVTQPAGTLSGGGRGRRGVQACRACPQQAARPDASSERALVPGQLMLLHAEVAHLFSSAQPQLATQHPQLRTHTPAGQTALPGPPPRLHSPPSAWPRWTGAQRGGASPVVSRRT